MLARSVLGVFSYALVSAAQVPPGPAPERIGSVLPYSSETEAAPAWRVVEKTSSPTISVSQLGYEPPRKARKLVEKSDRAVENGDREGAIALLRQALEQAPDYLDARLRLGLQLAALDRAPEAIEQLQTVLRQDPKCRSALLTLGILNLRSGNPKAAQWYADRALALERDSRALFLQALILAERKGGEAEALVALRKVAGERPQARIIAAGILERLGDRGGMVSELEQYLQSGASFRRDEVRRWLESLR